MTSRQRRISPGPSWAVLSEPPSSSPSTYTSIRSDIDLDMGDDEADHEPDPVRAPIAKRKAPTDESGAARKPHKLPRLDLANGGTSAGRLPSSSASPSNNGDASHASRTQPAPSSFTQKNFKTPFTLECLRRGQSTSSGTSTSDFPQTLSQMVQAATARAKEKGTEKTREQDAATSLQRWPQATARKRTAQAKNVRNVTLPNLLKNAQKPSDPRDESVAWTRVRPRGRGMSSGTISSTSNTFTTSRIAKRTNYNEEMAHVRPLDAARQRGSDAIEPTDSGDITRRPRPSQPSYSSGPRLSISAGKDDPIIITSSSEDDRVPAIRPSQRRNCGPGGTQGRGVNRKGAPPPADAEVISILDSDEDLGTSGAASKRPTVSAASPSTSRAPPPPPPPVPKPAIAPAPATTPASTSTQLPEHPPSRPKDTQRRDNELPPQPSTPSSYGPPPDDFEDAFGNMDFDTTSDDANPGPGGALDGWDNPVVGPLLAALPASGPVVAAVAAASASVPEGGEDELESDSLFDSYLNMDQLAGDVGQGTSEAALPGGGDEAEERAVEGGVTNGLGASTRETSGTDDNPNVDGDMCKRNLEEGELDPNEAPAPRPRSPPENGEIRSQESLREARKESQPPSQPVTARLAPGPTLAQPLSPGPASPHSSASAKSASQPLERARMLVMPDISSYKGVQFRRPRPESRENPFFSRALNGAARAGKTSESGEVRNEQRERSGSGGVSTPVQLPSSVGVVQNQAGDTNMQDDTAVSMPGPSRVSDAVLVQMPPPALQIQRPAETPMIPVTQGPSSSAQVPPSTPEPNTTANDNAPAFTQPTTSFVQATPSQLPAATQPLVRSSSRPVIAPPRVPRPSTPMSLVEVLNEVRREKLQAREEERELARRRSVVDLAAEQATPSTNINQGPKETPVPMHSPSPSLTRPATPASSTSQPVRALGRTPSLKELRTLLARRNAGAGGSARPTPTATSASTPKSTSNDDEDGHADGESHASTEPVAMPAPAPKEASTSTASEPVPIPAPEPAPMQAPTSTTSKDGKEAPPSEGARTTKSALWGTPTPATTTASGSGTSTSSSARARRRQTYTFVPFEAFISPVQSRGESDKGKSVDKGKGKQVDVAHAVDPFGSSVAARPHVPMGASAGLERCEHKHRGRASWHGRRKSASAAFEEYIVRDSPKQTSGTRAGTGADRDAVAEISNTQSLPEPPAQPRFSEGLASLSIASRVVPDAVPVPESHDGGDGDGDRRADNTNAMNVTMEAAKHVENVDAGDVGVDSTRMDDGMVLGEGKGEGEGRCECECETRGEAEAEVDEMDTLLELASVHLSQPEDVVEQVPGSCIDEVNKSGEMDVTEELAGASGVEALETRVIDGSEREVVSAMVVDGPPEDLEMREGDEGETVTQIVLDDAPSLPSQTEANEPELPAPDVVTPVNVAITSAVAPEEIVIQDDLQDDPVEASSRSTSPDLVLPKNPFAEFLSTSKDADQDVAYDDSHQRRPSGGADSVDECDVLLIPGEGGSESEAVPISSLVSSRTVSSTSLAPPRVRSRSSKSSSKQRSRAASSPSPDPLLLSLLPSPSRAASSPDLLLLSPRPAPPRAASSPDPLVLVRRPAPVADQAQRESASRSGPKYMGGYRIVTWSSYVAEQRERPPEYKLARDLPHSLQDCMNMLPVTFRNSDLARRIFEAHIQEAMIKEPDAPLIEIFDNDIGDEVTPRWEFHYTNEMWYGKGVPPPDVKHLESCGCVGRCDPRSGKCACAQRQLKWVQSYIDGEIIPPTWPGSPFVYDHKGMLQRLECPIFECNRFCNCDDDCPNRVVQNGRRWPVHIVKTEHKGWGVSAGNKKIPKGSYIGIYAGELLTEQEGDKRGRLYDLYGRTYLFSVDFHHLKLGMENPDEWDNLYVVDAYHAGNFTRFLNHSCNPNCKIFACYIDDADINKPLLAVFTTRDVEPWEELCFSYYGDIDEKREEIEEAREAGEELVREHAVYGQCRCEADNCIGRLFS